MRHIRLRVGITPEGFGPEYCCEMQIDRDGIGAIIDRASGASASDPRWRDVSMFVWSQIERALLEWARSAAPNAVQRRRAEREIGPLTIENLQRHIMWKLEG